MARGRSSKQKVNEKDNIYRLRLSLGSKCLSVSYHPVHSYARQHACYNGRFEEVEVAVLDNATWEFCEEATGKCFGVTDQVAGYVTPRRLAEGILKLCDLEGVSEHDN